MLSFHDSLMLDALALADQAVALGEAPIACVVAKADGTPIGWGWNELVAKRDRTAHAEMSAFRDAAGRYNPESDKLILVCTLEPCVMCFGASVLSGVETIVYALEAPDDGGPPRVAKPTSPETSWPTIIGGVRRSEARDRFVRWLDLHPETGHSRDYIAALVASTKH